MSVRDKQLLDAAGLSVGEVAELIGRSKPALYQGIAGEDPYFSMAEIAFIVNDARRRESVHLSDLARFIERDFDAQQAELILIEHVNFARLVRHAMPQQCDLVLLHNGGVGHLAEGAYFARFLNELGQSGRHAALAAPAKWMEDYLAETFPRLSVSFFLRKSLEHGSTAALLRNATEVRAFVFTLSGVEEVSGEDAKKLWSFYGDLSGDDEDAGNRKEVG